MNCEKGCGMNQSQLETATTNTSSTALGRIYALVEFVFSSKFGISQKFKIKVSTGNDGLILHEAGGI